MKANDIVTIEEMKALLTDLEQVEPGERKPVLHTSDHETGAEWVQVVKALREQIDSLNHRVHELENKLLHSAADQPAYSRGSAAKRNHSAPFGIGTSLAAESASRYMAAASEIVDGGIAPIGLATAESAILKPEQPALSSEPDSKGSRGTVEAELPIEPPASRLERYGRKKSGIRKFFG